MSDMLFTLQSCNFKKLDPLVTKFNPLARLLYARINTVRYHNATAEPQSGTQDSIRYVTDG